MTTRLSGFFRLQAACGRIYRLRSSRTYSERSERADARSAHLSPSFHKISTAFRIGS